MRKHAIPASSILAGPLLGVRRLCARTVRSISTSDVSLMFQDAATAAAADLFAERHAPVSNQQ